MLLIETRYITDMARELISREEARASGLKRFFTGELCRNGHIDERNVSSGNCYACVRQNAAKWAKENPSRLKDIQARYYATHVEQVRIKNAIWRGANLEKHRSLLRQWRKENPWAINRHAATYREKHRSELRTRQSRWRLDNPEKVRQMLADWYQNNAGYAKAKAIEWARANPEAVRTSTNLRRARKSASSGSYSVFDVRRILKIQRGRCAYCRSRLNAGYHVDHIFPLSRGGSNSRQNIQITCGTCNLRKSAKDPLFFARQMGFLL